MPFCQNCGNKVSDTAKFCGSCGAQVEIQNLTEKLVNATKPTKELNSPPTPIESNSVTTHKSPKTWQEKLKAAIVAAVVLGTVLWVGDTFFTSNTYPQSKTEFKNLFIGTYWHLTEYEIIEFHLNNEQIIPAKNEIDFNSKTIVESLELEFEKFINDYGNFFMCGVDNEIDDFLIYEQSFDNNQSEYVYSISSLKIMGKDENGKYRYQFDNDGIDFSVETGLTLFETLDNIVTQSTVTVENITENEIELVERVEFSGDASSLLIAKTKYKAIRPTVEPRVEELQSFGFEDK